MSYFKTTDNVDIYYDDAGKGDPTIFIHGWPLSGAMWEYQMVPLLERGHRVITYDRRGFGRSSQNSETYNYDVFADDLKQLIDHLQLSKVNLVGFSMGGGEIARYLSRYGSQKIGKVALISSVVPYMLKTKDNPAGVPVEVFNQMKTQLREDRPHFLSNFNKSFYGVGWIQHPVSDEILEWSAHTAYLASAKATIDCVTAFGETDFRNDMKAFTIPTLIIHGDADKTVPIDPTARAAAMAITGSILKIYQGAAHGLFVTHKKNLFEDLSSFLRH